ncbi:hypothetical protein pb186bvf_008569 [Paramecium bursaria]
MRRRIESCTQTLYPKPRSISIKKFCNFEIISAQPPPFRINRRPRERFRLRTNLLDLSDTLTIIKIKKYD